ncbi:MAG: metallophosphoesterase [bacterium]
MSFKAVICAAVLSGLTLELSALNTGPLVQCITDSSVIIAVEFDSPFRAELGYKKENKLIKTIISTPNKRHEFTVKGLDPATRYFYTIKKNGSLITLPAREYYFFTSPDKREPFTLAVYGDTRGGEESFGEDHRAVIDAVMNYTVPDFVVHAGDMADPLEKKSWQNFFDIENVLLRQVPFFCAAGNSEMQGETGDYFALPGNEKWYSFNYGNCRFIVLHLLAGWGKQFFSEFGPGSIQYKWLESELKSPDCRKADFRVVFFHCPVFKPDGKGSRWVQSSIVPLMEQYGVDLVINGSVHYFSHLQSKGINYVITGGGGASITQIGRSRSENLKAYHPLFHHTRIRVSYPQLQVEAVDNSGNIFYNFAITAREIQGKVKKTSENKEISSILNMKEGEIKIEVYGSRDCEYCQVLKSEILPQFKTIGKVKITPVFYYLDDQENFERFINIENKLNDKGNAVPAIVVGDRILGGISEIEDNLHDAVWQAAENKNNQPQGVKYIFFIIAVIMVTAMIFLFVKKK